jgi:hypothetical protein
LQDEPGVTDDGVNFQSHAGASVPTNSLDVAPNRRELRVSGALELENGGLRGTQKVGEILLAGALHLAEFAEARSCDALVVALTTLV